MRTVSVISRTSCGAEMPDAASAFVTSVDDSRVRDVATRDVDGHGQVRRVGAGRPGGELLAGVGEDPGVEVADEVAFFGRSDEVGRRDQAHAGAAPPDESFVTFDIAGGDANDGLVVQDEFVVADGLD